MNTRTNNADATNGALIRLALVYLITGFAVFLLMGLLGLLMRLDQAGITPLPPQWFYQIMTLHGSGMVAASMLAAMGGFAAVLSPTVRMSLRWLWAIFAIYLLGVVLVIIAIVLGRFAAGWTMLPPLPYESKGFWGLSAALAMYTGYLFIALGFLAYCINILIATVKAYGGLDKALAWNYLFTRNAPTPLPRPVDIMGVVVAIAGVITVLAGAILLVPLFLQAAGLIAGINALFAKNFLYLFGHTLVNLNIYLSAGLVYTLLPIYARREWKTTWPIALALNLALLLVPLAYFHHLYQDFVQILPLHILGQIASFGVPLPAFLVTILSSLGLMYRSGLRWSVPTILIVLGLWGWTFGGMGAVLDAPIGVNQVLHNTLWVPAHFHTYYLLGAVAFAWAYLYHLLSELSSFQENTFSKIAAWLYGFGGAGFVIMFFLSGADSVPRRYAVHLPEWQKFALVSIPFVAILIVGIGWLAVEMMTHLKRAWQGTQTMK